MRLDLGENGSADPAASAVGMAPPPVDQEPVAGAPQTAVARLIDTADAGLVQDFRHAGRDDGGIDHAEHFGGKSLHLLGDRQRRLRRDPCLDVDADLELDLGGRRLGELRHTFVASIRLPLSRRSEPFQIIEDALDCA